MTKYLVEILDDYKNGVYDNPEPIPSSVLYFADHIFDEDKSVKWNRQQVVIKNEAIKTRKKEWIQLCNKLTDSLTNDIIESLMMEFNFNRLEAEKAYFYIYDRHHSSGYYEIINSLIEFGTFLNDFKKCSSAQK